jgi:hypothetical protein
MAIAQAWCDAHGSIDVVAAQTIGLCTSFGPGDADLQLTALTCANRASEAFSLARPEARTTLGVDDIPQLCAITGARRFIPYGQFKFARGDLACSSGVTDRLAEVLAASRSEAHVCRLAVGQGLSLDSEMAVVTGALA